MQDFSRQKVVQATRLLKLLSNPTRLMVVCALLERSHNAGELTSLVGSSQSAVSQHLSRLRAERVVKTSRVAQEIRYSLQDKSVRALVRTLHKIYCS